MSRIDQQETDPGRRGFLRAMAAGGVSVPASYFLIGDPIKSARAVENPAGKGELRGNTSFGLRRKESAPKEAQFIRDFSDPYLELVRLLREAAEVEHSLMIQYLYAAFSIKPVYAGLVGDLAPTTDTFMGVAVQEMQHLGAVNRLLAALGSTPNLATQDLPYEPEIYPFEVKLESCGPVTLSKYSYCEAPPAALDRAKAKNARDREYIDTVDRVLGTGRRPNFVGSFYETLIATLEEYGKTGEAADELSKPFDTAMWVEKLRAIQEEGEDGHFEFFKDVLLGTHKGFNGRPKPWALPSDDKDYPSYRLPENPSAFVGHPNQISSPVALSLAWLSNLHYWLSLSALTYAYHFSSMNFIGVAQRHMIGPMLSLGRELPKHGAAAPFDQLSMGYCPGLQAVDCLRFIQHLAAETIAAEDRLEGHLPADYDRSVMAETNEEVEQLFEWMKVSRL